MIDLILIRQETLTKATDSFNSFHFETPWKNIIWRRKKSYGIIFCLKLENLVCYFWVGFIVYISALNYLYFCVESFVFLRRIVCIFRQIVCILCRIICIFASNRLYFWVGFIICIFSLNSYLVDIWISWKNYYYLNWKMMNGTSIGSHLY